MNKDRRTLQRLQRQTARLLKVTRRQNPNKDFSTSSAAGAANALFQTLGGVIATGGNSLQYKVSATETVGSVRQKLKGARSDTNQAIRQNQKIKRLLSKCKKRKIECSCEPGEYPAALVFRSGDVGTCACFNRGFVQWDATLSENASSVTAVTDWACANPRERTVNEASPYDNVYSMNAGEVVLEVPNGSNWIYVTGNSAADLNGNRCAPDCSTGLSNLMRCVVNPRVRVNCRG